MDTEQQIVELIDEIAYLESQIRERDETVREAKTSATGRETMLVEGMEALIGYITAIEQGVLLPALGEFSTYVTRNATRTSALQKVAQYTAATPQFPRLNHLLTFLQVPNTIADSLTCRKVEGMWERPQVQPDEGYVALAMLVAQREQLEQLLARAAHRTADLTGIPLPSSGPTLARALGDAQQDRAAAAQRVAQLEERLACDKATVSSSLEALKHALTQSTDECRALRNDNSRLLEELNSVRRSVSALGGSTPRGSTRPAMGTVAAPTEHAMKLAAFELTVAALNDELGGVEGRIGGLERKHEGQRKGLTDELEALRRQYDDERRECDAFVQRMMQEMEMLWKENEDLRRTQGREATTGTPIPIPKPPYRSSPKERRVR